MDSTARTRTAPRNAAAATLTALALVSGAAAVASTAAAPAMSAVSAAPTLCAPIDQWTAFYEDPDQQPLAGSPAAPAQNITEIAIDAHDAVTAVTSNFPNAESPDESIEHLLDRDPETKWYAGTGNAPSPDRPIYAIYSLSRPAAITGYQLTSGNDAPERDPASWQVLGSNDPQASMDAEHPSWTEVDARENVTFDGRETTETFDAEPSQSYAYYQLRTTAIRGGSDDTRFQISDWTLLGTADDLGGSGLGVMVTSVEDASPLVGSMAVRYSGEVVSDGAATASVTLHDGLDLSVSPGTMLTYLVRPADTQSAHVTLDIAYRDGSGTSRNLTADASRTDVNREPLTAADRADVLVSDRWNTVAVDLSDLTGATVESIVLSLDAPQAEQGDLITGLVDDVTVSTAVADATTTWSYSDDGTDPAAGHADRTSWTAQSHSVDEWPQGSGGFGATSGTLGGGYPIDTPLQHFSDGVAAPVNAAYFFRTTVELDAVQIASMRGLYGSIIFDDSATVYVNGMRVTGWGDAAIDGNLDYQDEDGEQDPVHRVFSIPVSMLQEGENTIAVEIHQCNESSSDVYFQMPSLVATP